MRLKVLSEDQVIPIIYVDVDETLVKTSYLPQDTSFDDFVQKVRERAQKEIEEKDDYKFYIKELEKLERGVPVEFKGQGLWTIPRPSAEPFLKKLAKYPLEIFTSGDADFQTLALKKLGLLQYFRAVHSTRDRSISPPGVPFVLVDDLPSGSSGMTEKMNQLLGREDGGYWSSSEGDKSGREYHEPHLVTVKGFWGEDDPQPLTSYIPEIERKISKLS